jgi:hypothetical protein
MKGDRVIADGISMVEPRAFQSFVCKLISDKINEKHIAVPMPIVRHLGLEHENILEVAIRRVTKEYAKEAYGKSFWSFKAKCPKCGKNGTLIQMREYYSFRHYLDGRFTANHYISKEQAEKLIAEHEKAVGVRVQDAQTEAVKA